MATDIRLDDDAAERWVTIDAGVLNVTGSDLLLDSPARRRGGGARFRRALVHDANDGLTINFDDDYSGGVRINDAVVNLRVVTQGAKPQLPKEGSAGDLVLTRNVTTAEGGVVLGEQYTLWLCVGRPDQQLGLSGVSWLPVSTGQPVKGTT